MRVLPAAASLRERKLAAVTPVIPSEARSSAIRSIAIQNLAGELQWKTGARPVSLSILDSRGPWWSLEVSRSASELVLRVNEKSIALPPPSAPEIEFHLLLDASVAEFFLNRLQVITSRIYRRPDGPLRVQIGGADLASLREFAAWQLRAISADRLTT